MFQKRLSCTKSLLILLVSTLSVLFLDTRLTLLPFTGLYLFFYILILITISVWCTFLLVQHVLNRDKPFVYREQHLNYIYNKVIDRPKLTEESSEDSLRKTIDDRIEEFVQDLDRYFIRKWYVYISGDSNFPEESKLLLDTIVRRFLQVLPDLDSSKCFHGLVIIYLRHLKEYKRSLKRAKKYNKDIEDFYRYTHSEQDAESLIQKLTSAILRQFINWELWHSLPCQCLSLIISKQFTCYFVQYLSLPKFINYKLVQLCSSDSVKQELQLDRFGFISTEEEKQEDCKEIRQKPEKLTYLSVKNLESCTPKMSPKKNYDKTDSLDKKQKIPKSEPVKIYESKSCRTWRNLSDLGCVSLGEDLLSMQQDLSDPDTQIQELIEKKLWKDGTEEDVPDSWLEDDVESSSNLQNAANIISHTIKPIGNATVNTLNNMKELQQSTVNNVVKPVSQATTNAMHKIGDLQDEAAGMMEGILDYGMARIRKGLNLSGLQENINEFTQKAKHEFHRQDAKVTPVKTAPKSGCDFEKDEDCGDLTEETAWMNPLSKDSFSFDGNILLESQTEKRPFLHEIPQISEELLEDSPDLEYEETPDLTTAIAKLRSLLQQKSSESALTTPSLSPMPQEEVPKSTTPMESGNDYLKPDGPTSLYKFCARTATGVFQNTLNTIKTALPGNDTGNEQDRSYKVELLEADPISDDFHSRIKKLLSERRAFCTVDAAYEALHSLEAVEHADESRFVTDFHLEDDRDESDYNLPITEALLDIVCELIDSNSSLVREASIKSLLILIGNYSEDFAAKYSERCLLQRSKRYIGKLPENFNQDVLDMSVEEIAKICSSIVPDYVRKLLGEETVFAALKLFVSSVQNYRMNRDLFLQVLELFAAEVICANRNVSPAYSA